MRRAVLMWRDDDIPTAPERQARAKKKQRIILYPKIGFICALKISIIVQIVAEFIQVLNCV